MPMIDIINSKLNSIGTMISDLQNNVKVVERIGGATFVNMNGEIEFQKSRQANLEWALTVTDTDIQDEIDNLESLLTSEELACKYGSVRGLPADSLGNIAKIEDLELALGTHPALGGNN